MDSNTMGIMGNTRVKPDLTFFRKRWSFTLIKNSKSEKRWLLEEGGFRHQADPCIKGLVPTTMEQIGWHFGEFCNSFFFFFFFVGEGLDLCCKCVTQVYMVTISGLFGHSPFVGDGTMHPVQEDINTLGIDCLIQRLTEYIDEIWKEQFPIFLWSMSFPTQNVTIKLRQHKSTPAQ